MKRGAGFPSLLTRLWFTRHGEVEPHMVGTFVGTTDCALSPLGRHQAEAIAKYLEDASIDAIVSSPRKRALDTIAPLARAKGMKLDVHKALGEMDYGKWEGLHWDQIVTSWPDLAREFEKDPATVPCPGGESGDMFFARVQEEVAQLAAEFKGRTVLVSGHAGTNRAILAHVMKRPWVDCFQFAQDYGCVNAVGWGESGFGQVALVNFVPGPRSASQGE
jgi:broad specificity phosphatase PhoE